MKPLAVAVALFLVFTALAPQAQAQTVWRCGDGGPTYSEIPCPGGQPVKAADPRTAAQAQLARDAVKRDQDLTARMHKERLEKEGRNRAANAGAASLGPDKATTPPSNKITQKHKASRQHPTAVPADDGTWRAAAVPSRRKKD